jgi:general stress protein 26
VRDSDLKLALDAMKKIRVAMATATKAEGMSSRPLTANIIEDSDDIYFLVPADSEICTQIAANNAIHLSFADPGSHDYVSVDAEASVRADAALATKLWSPFAQAWFPNGPSDPNVRIITASPSKIDHWAGDSNILVMAWKIGKSLLTKTPPDIGTKSTISL